jgi:hypothetical protein
MLDLVIRGGSPAQGLRSAAPVPIPSRGAATIAAWQAARVPGEDGQPWIAQDARGVRQARG